MSFRKFGPNDIVLNTMRAFPQVRFDIYNTKVYYNNTPHQINTLGTSSAPNNILGITSSGGGGISLHEFNIDRAGSYSLNDKEQVISKSGSNLPITTYNTTGSARSAFRTANSMSFNNEFKYVDIIRANYPLTASITREFMSPEPGFRNATVDTLSDVDHVPGSGSAAFPHFYALKNRLNHYRYLSEHYAVSSSFNGGFDKALQPINLISIPSIFYGTQIKEGSVSLKYYISGTLQAECRDTKENGELIQVSGAASDNGKVAGVVMYNEGFILLTGSWQLNDQTLPLINGKTAGGLVTSKWIYFGVGANDGIETSAIDNVRFASASFEILFNGHTETQVQTMFAHAHRGQVNHSNNPTFIEYNQELLNETGSQVYEENPVRRIKNTVSSSFATYDAPFKRQVYISRVAVYDAHKNLIGIASLTDPVLKEEGQDYTFKLKLDI